MVLRVGRKTFVWIFLLFNQNVLTLQKFQQQMPVAIGVVSK